MAGSFLRQSTASQSRATPPFVDETDGKTAETGLTIANTDVKLIVNGGASANKNSGGGTHRANGVYGLTFDATDTATVGEMEVSIVVAGALPVFMKFWVLEEAIYDAMFASGASVFPANVTQISGDSGAADNLEAAADGTGYNLGGGSIVAQLDNSTIAAMRSAATNPATTPTIDQLIEDFPHPFTSEILTVTDRAFEILERNCPLTRGTTYYIEYDAAGNGTGGTGNGSFATPWLVSTWNNLKTLIEAQQTGGDKAFLFKRGEGLLGTGQINITADNVTVGAYGSGAKPYGYRATRVSSGWTNVTGTKYTRTETSDVAWVRLPGSKTLPLSMLSSAASVPTTITGCGGTFHYDSGTDVLTVDMGIDLNSNTVEIIYDNTDSGFYVTGDGCRIDNWELAGFGMDIGNEANQNCAVRVTFEGEKCALITNCGMSYGSTHVSEFYGSGAGGHVGWDGCDASWAIPSVGPTILVAYAPDGDHSGYFRNCYNLGGELPSGTTPSSDAAFIYGHSNGTPARLFLAQNCEAVSSSVTPFISTINAWGHAPTTNGDIGLCRAYFINCDIGELYATTAAADAAFINTRGKYYAVGSGSVGQQQVSDDRGYWVNHKQEIIVNTSVTSTHWAMLNKASGTHDAQRYNCEIRWTGTDTNTTCWWDYRTGIFSEAGDRTWQGCTYINDTAIPNVVFAGGNVAGNLAGNKFYSIASLSNSVAGATTDTYYSSAVLGASPRVGMAPGNGSELSLGTFLIGPEYDYNGKPRNINDVTAGIVAPNQSSSWGAPKSTAEIASAIEASQVGVDTAATQALAEGANGFAAIKTDASAAATSAANAKSNTDQIIDDVSNVPTNAELATALDPLPTANENRDAILNAVLSGFSTAGSVGKAIADVLVDTSTTLPAAIDGIEGGGGTSQPRINRKPDPGFTTKVSRRSDGTYKCTKPIRLTAGNINQVYVFIDMSPLFGPDNFVQTVGTLSVSAGDIEEGDEKGPRDTYAVLELDGSADDCTCTVPVTMTSGTTVPVVFDVEVLE